MKILRRDGSLLLELPTDKAGTLNGSFLYEADLALAVLDGQSMQAAELGHACLKGASLRGVSLYWADCADADFSDADLEGADLRGANLRNVRFGAARLVKANLGFDAVQGRTRLQGADLSSTELEGARFEGAEYDARTSFPAGFDPTSHHMVQGP